MAEIKSLSHTHVELMDYMMSNPTIALGDVARHFGYTQPWLSQIIHSDAFQVMLQEKQGIAFHHTVMSVKDKMLAVAHAALDKVANLIPNEVDTRTAQDVAEGMLDRLGYGAKPVTGPGGMNMTINQQNNFVVPNANAAEIANARAMLLATQPALGVQVNGVSTPLALPRTSLAEMGPVISEADFSAAAGENPERESGAQV